MKKHSVMPPAPPKYSDKQEVIHSIIHGFGVIFGISFLPVLVSLAVRNNNIPGIIGASIYSFCFLMQFSFSTLYHSFREHSIKQTLKVYDHISIYFLIAGTYTPFLLIYMNNQFGVTLLAVLWGLSFLGIIFKAYYTGRFETISTVVYIMMGSIMLVGGKTFFEGLPFAVIAFILAGAVLYIAGAIIYLWDKYTYTHAVWHSMVLTAAICHYVAVLLSV